MGRELIYFDNAASTPLATPVAEAISECLTTYYGNPSSTHAAGRRARVIIENARRTVARSLNVSPSEIFFTSGGTEANNAILWGCIKDLGRKVFITSSLEHPAVLNTLNAIKRHMGAHLVFVNHDADGHIELDHLKELLKENPGAVVSLMHANNEIGNLLPVKTVAALCHEAGALFHSDMIQTIGKYHIDLQAHQVDFSAGSAHKIHGPKGIGFMYVRKGCSFQPFITGGGQERGMRAGTENLCGIVGLAKAMEWSLSGLDKAVEHIESLKNLLITRLMHEIPGTIFNGDCQGRSLYSILNFSLPLEKGGAMLLPRLDMAGVCVSSGSACASGASKESHVLHALGIGHDVPSVRVSFSRFNTHEEVELLVQVLKNL